MQTNTHTIDAAMAAIGSKTTYAGAGTTITGWLLTSEGAALVGILMGLAGLVVNFYFRRREDRRLQAEHEARLVLIRAGFPL